MKSNTTKLVKECESQIKPVKTGETPLHEE